MIVSWPISHGVKDVVAIRPKPFDTGEFCKPPSRTATCQDSDELDGLGDHRARYRDDGFLDQLLHPSERTECRARMDGADAAGMPGSPGLQEIERFGAPDFTDRDAIRPQPQRGANQIRERAHA